MLSALGPLGAFEALPFILANDQGCDWTNTGWKCTTAVRYRQRGDSIFITHVSWEEKHSDEVSGTLHEVSSENFCGLR